MRRGQLDVLEGRPGASGPRSAWSDSALWDREYAAVRAIPSSLRRAPSRAFRRLVGSLGDLSGMRVLDLGAGTGRHAIYAARRGARVHAIDASDIACGILSARAEAMRCASSITVEQGSVTVAALPDGRFDLIIDSYATCHLLTAAERFATLEALMTRLSHRGRLYTAGMGDADAFYREHVEALPGAAIAVDPRNGIPKLLQPSDTPAQDATNLGRLLATTTERFPDAVAGHRYVREVHASVLAR